MMFVYLMLVIMMFGRHVYACTIVVKDCHEENQVEQNRCQSNKTNDDTKMANQTKEIVALCEKQTTNIITILNLQMSNLETNLEEKLKQMAANIQRILTESQIEQTRQLIWELQKFKGIFEVQPNMTNLALGKPAQQHPDDSSQSFYNYRPSNAVDGNLDTYSHTTSGRGPRYWFVDLGNVYSIKRVEIYNRDARKQWGYPACCGARLHDLDVTVGTSLQSMELCGTFKGPGKDGQHIVLECPKIITGRYVKLTIPEPEWLHVAEVEVYGY